MDWSYEYYLSQWSIIIGFLILVHNIKNTHVFNMHLSTFFENASAENTCCSSSKLSYKYMKLKHQL